MTYYNKSEKVECIKPSARRSIHSHNCCPFDNKHTMGHHGLVRNKYNITNFNLPGNQHTKDIDEVDNIISKFAKAVEVPYRNNKKNQRRSSLDTHIQDFSSDDSNMLSKSLPSSYLPTKPCCSEDSYSEHDISPILNISNQSTYITRNTSQNESSNNHEESSYISENSQHSTRQIEIHSETSYLYQWLVIPAILVVLGVTYQSGIIGDFQNKFEDNTVSGYNKYDKLEFYTDLSNVGEKYKVNKDTILQLQTGISLISQKQDTDSFMFVYNSEGTNFGLERFKDFVNEVASVSAKYLRNESSTVRHIEVDSSKLFLRDSTELIEKYRADVSEHGVLLLMGIDTLPSSLAMALHYYCDEYNPLVKKSAIFSTLDLANCCDQETTHAHIERCLSKKWHSVPADNIGPLLTRVVSVVVDLTNEFLMY